jgi:ABC-2 type transport system permease protein
LLIGISIAVFGASFDTLGMLEAIPFIILGAIVCMAIGQMIAALIRKPETVQIVSQVVFFPLMFLSGLFIPMNQLPDAVQAFGKFLPTATISDLIRGPMLNSFIGGALNITNLPMLVSLAGVLIYFVIAVALAARYFKWD